MGDIELRPPLPADAEVLFPLVAETSVCDTLAWDGPESAEEFGQGLVLRALQVLAGDKHFFTIVLKETGQPIGSCDLRFEDNDTSQANVGLWIGEPFQGKGYGTQVVGALVDYGFSRLGLDMIYADIFVGNWASRRAFEKNGFRLDRTEPAALIKRGRPVNEWIVELSRTGYQAGPAPD
jgi:ribosomal-protein-alanine N-acetyltransferase